MGRCWSQVENKPRRPDNSLATCLGPVYYEQTKFYCWSCKIKVGTKMSPKTGRWFRPSKCPKCGHKGLIRLRGEE